MKTVISQPLSTTAAATPFHHRFFHATTFPGPPLDQRFHFFPGDINFACLRCKAVYKPNKDVSFVNEQQAMVERNSSKRQNPYITNSQEINDIKKHVKEIKSIFDSIDDGAISLSAYDTAWAALIENVNGQTGGPQFPSSLEWVANNQLPDGSWGEPLLFLACDRLVNTLACVIALTTWNVHPDKCQKGMEFIYENLNKVGDDKEEHFTPGFELVFPALIDLARKVDIKMPHDSPFLKEIYARRDMKLTKIPKDIMHKTPTTLLYSLEGMKDLEWDKILKLQSENGSIVLSPAPTAFTYMHTKNKNCLAYLTNLVAKFNGGVPNIHPADLFERSWMVDRLQRLGIARYFQNEIKDCVDHIYRYWDEQGIGFGRNCNLPDLDDTAMAFRVLRISSYQVNPDVFRYFKKDGEFMCYQGQSIEGLTVMFNLYRASQMLFPGEKILNDAKNFTHKVLSDKRSTNELLDRWIITKDLSGEVGYALDVPLYASLPRLETRYYLEQYGGEDDVWIAKSLYRMKNVSNNKYLEMAKLDYNHCQAIHQLEWSHIEKWYAHLNIEKSLKTKPLWSYYEAAASIFEPERCNERVAWAKTTVLLNTMNSFFAKPHFSNTDMQTFVDEFTNPQHLHEDGKPSQMLVKLLHENIHHISSEALEAHGVDIFPHLHSAWKAWLSNWQKGMGVMHGEAELIVRTINLSSGRWLSEELLSHPQYKRISSITNDICHQISHKENSATGFAVDSKMQQLMQLVFCDSSPNDLDLDLKQTFLMVAKTFYYRAYFNPETIDHHMHKVLFERAI